MAIRKELIDELLAGVIESERGGVFTRDRRPKMAAHFLRSRWTQK